MNEPIKFEDAYLDKHLNRAINERPEGHFSISNFDELLGGIYPGRLTFISGEPGAGKTTLLLCLADEAAQNGYISIVNTLELSPHQLLIKSLARLSNGALSVGDIPKEQHKAKVEDIAALYRETIAPNILFIDKALSSVELGAKIGRIQREYDKPVVLFQDYVQIMPSNTEQQIIDERLAVKNAVSGLREIANSHDIAVFAISSINRTNYSKPTPTLAALGASSSIEYAADTIIHLAIDAGDSSPVEVSNHPIRPVVATTLKARYSCKGTAKLVFNAPQATFTDRTDG